MDSTRRQVQKNKNRHCWLRCKNWAGSEAGVTSIEYALVGILIAVVIIGGVTMVGTELNNIYEYISHCVEDWSCD